MPRVRWFACLNVCSCTCTTYTVAYLLTLLYVGPLFCTDIHTYGVLSTFSVYSLGGGFPSTKYHRRQQNKDWRNQPFTMAAFGFYDMICSPYK